jgi:hypothetical protein
MKDLIPAFISLCVLAAAFLSGWYSDQRRLRRIRHYRRAPIPSYAPARWPGDSAAPVFLKRNRLG